VLHVAKKVTMHISPLEIKKEKLSMISKFYNLQKYIYLVIDAYKVNKHANQLC